MANDSNKKQGSDKNEFMGFEAEDLGEISVCLSKEPAPALLTKRAKSAVKDLRRC